MMFGKFYDFFFSNLKIESELCLIFLFLMFSVKGIVLFICCGILGKVLKYRFIFNMGFLYFSM